MHQIITSIDVGIRNLAYCVMEYDPENISGNQFKIHDWNVIDLLNNKQKNNKCQMKFQSGDKKGQICHNLAYYSINGMNVCKIHSKSYNHSQLTRFYTVSNISLYELARLAVLELDKIDFNHSQEIIIESQPSKNQKMKNFSMVLLNYFIIKYIAEKTESEQKLQDVKFISSRNKLTVYDGPYIECHLKGQHARNKFYGKIYCQYLIRNDFEKKNFFNSFKKRDDLADSFLQGAWYLMNKYQPNNHNTNKNQDVWNEKECINESYVIEEQQCDNPDHDDFDDPNPDEHDNEKNPEKKEKIKLKLKKKLVGKEFLQSIKNNESNIRIKVDYNLNKYKQLRRGSKPIKDAKKYTLSNIKYIIDHHLFDESNSILQSSMKYYFGNSKVEQLFGQFGGTP